MVGGRRVDAEISDGMEGPLMRDGFCFVMVLGRWSFQGDCRVN